MNELRTESPAARPAAPVPPGKAGWSLNRWFALIALVFAAHIGLLFAFGARQPVVPRPATGVPRLKLAGNTEGMLALNDPALELLALNDPTLFALPHPGDFVTATWLSAPVVNPPSFYWTEPTNWLSLSADELLTVFNGFMQTNRVAGVALQLKPPVQLGTPLPSIEPAFAPNSTMRIEGDLAQRQLLTPMVDLPSWPYADVIAPSRVQALVDEAGDVVSAVLLPSDNNLEALSHYDAADQRALELARAARFAPGPRLTLGRMIFTWRTVPLPATNAPAGSP